MNNKYDNFEEIEREVEVEVAILGKSFSNLPPVIYRHLGNPAAKENFSNGNIWIPGATQNRFFTDPSRRDESEDNYKSDDESISGNSINRYALSFTLKRPDCLQRSKAIEIRDIDQFRCAIIEDLKTNPKQKAVFFNPCFILSEIDKERTEKYSKAKKSLYSLEEEFKYVIRYLTLINILKKVKFRLTSIEPYLPLYDDYKNKRLDVLEPMEVTRAILAKPKKFRHEKELRFVFAGGFDDADNIILDESYRTIPSLSSFSILRRLLRYLKFECPSTKEFIK